MGGEVIDHDLHRDGYATKYGHYRRFSTVCLNMMIKKLRKFQILYPPTWYFHQCTVHLMCTLLLHILPTTHDPSTPPLFTSSSFPSALPIPASPSYATERFAHLTVVVPTPQIPQGVKAYRTWPMAQASIKASKHPSPPPKGPEADPSTPPRPRTHLI